MATTRELKGTREQIIRQIAKIKGKIVSVTLVVEEADPARFVPLSDEEFARIMKEMEAMAVHAPHADDSREAIYTRMPGE